MKKIHICLYLNDDEVLNINCVCQINFLADCIIVNTEFSSFWFRYEEFTRLEVDYYD